MNIYNCPFCKLLLEDEDNGVYYCSKDNKCCSICFDKNKMYFIFVRVYLGSFGELIVDKRNNTKGELYVILDNKDWTANYIDTIPCFDVLQYTIPQLINKIKTYILFS
jgi:hypothetical protein